MAVNYCGICFITMAPGAYPRRKNLKGPSIGFALPCPQIQRPDWKGFPRANPLAYQTSLSVTKEKTFITMTPGTYSQHFVFFIT